MVRAGRAIVDSVDWRDALAVIARKANCKIVRDSERLIRFTQPPAISMEFQDADIKVVLELLANNVVAQLDAFITDEYGRTRNQLANFVLGLAAKRTVEEFAVLVLTAGIVAHSVVASVAKKSICYVRLQIVSLYNMRTFRVQSDTSRSRHVAA